MHVFRVLTPKHIHLFYCLYNPRRSVYVVIIHFFHYYTL